MLLDTSGLFSFFDAGDSRHSTAAAHLLAAANKLTHNYVLAEFLPLCGARGLNRTRVLHFLTDLVLAPDVEVVWIDAFIHQQAMALLAARLDKTYSLCDAVSFVLMRGRGITEALTTDRHFEQEGFSRLLP